MDKTFQQILEDFEVVKKQLTEDYMFNGQEPMMDGGEQYPQEGAPMQQGQPQQGEGTSAEEEAMHAQEIIQHEPIIGKIRETAIEGLKKYAENPTSSIYAFFKKVFLESDKVLTDNGSGVK